MDEGARRVSAGSRFASVAEYGAFRSAKRLLEDNAEVTVPLFQGLHPARVWTEKFERVRELGSTVLLSGNCVAPVYVMLMSNRGTPTMNKESVTCHLRVRCRKCPECRDQQGRCWTARAYQELQSSARTWFCTLTFDWRHSRGDLTPLTYARRELTKFMKRLRERGSVFRYLAVFEAHQGQGASHGLPHIHLLLHETRLGSLLWKDVDREWKERGFHKTNLYRAEKGRPIAYMTKYLFKDRSICRIRASIGYGSSHVSDAARKGGLSDYLHEKPQGAALGRVYPSNACVATIPRRTLAPPAIEAPRSNRHVESPPAFEAMSLSHSSSSWH